MNYLKPGLGNTASYQVSGIPWVSSSIAPSSGDIVSFGFPQVTKFVTIKNSDSVPSTLRIGFDPKQIEYETGEYFELAEGETVTLDIRVTNIYFQAQDAADVSFGVVAGLTGINKRELPSQATTSDIAILSESGDLLITENNSVIIVE